MLIAALSIPRNVAFQIFLGVGGLSSELSQAFIVGMHSALLVSISLLVVAVALSVLRGKEHRRMNSYPA